MAIEITKDPEFSPGSSISFSSLKDRFYPDRTGPISLSDYKRQISKNEPNPVIPDCTENSNISSSNNNLKLSGYQESITFYYMTQTETNTNLDIDLENWNNNLNKNIPKRFIVKGEIGSLDPEQGAASLDAEVYNLQIRIEPDGSIIGAGGANGGNGGDGLYVNSTGGNVSIYGSADKILAGGGSGGNGGNGGSGGDGPTINGSVSSSGGNGGSGGSGGSGQGYNNPLPGSGSLGGNGQDRVEEGETGEMEENMDNLEKRK